MDFQFSVSVAHHSVSFRVALLMSSRILIWRSQGLPEEVNEILNHHDFGSCQNLSTNELGGWFLACQDVHGRALNRKFPDFLEQRYERTCLITSNSQIRCFGLAVPGVSFLVIGTQRPQHETGHVRRRICGLEF